MGRFDGYVVVATGAAQGSGLATVKAFLNEGAKVIGLDINEELLMKEAGNINSPSYDPVAMDVASEDDWKKLVAHIKEKYGQIDVLANIAAVYTNADILKVDYESYKRDMAINLDGPMLGMKYCYEVLKKGGHSSIINVSSCAGIRAGKFSGYSVAYSTSKSGLLNLTRHAAVIFAKDSIRVNTIIPAGINTELKRKAMEDHPVMREEQAINNPLPPHVNEPEDIANVIMFFAGKESRTVTGAQLLVDNGQTAQ